MPFMPKIKSQDMEVEFQDSEDSADYFEKVGVPLGCRIGVCNVCKIKILSDSENLSELTENEIDSKLEKDERLACQCKVLKGEVKIKF